MINLLSDENFFHEEKKKAADIWHKFSLNSAKEDLAGNSEKNESYTGHVRKSVGNDEIFVPKISQKKTENAEIEQKTNFSLPTQNEDKIHGAAMQICFFAPEAPFSQNRSTILQNLMVFQKNH